MDLLEQDWVKKLIKLAEEHDREKDSGEISG